MIAKRPIRSCRHFFNKNTNLLLPKTPPRPLTTSPLPLPIDSPQDHKSLCFSLVDTFITRGLISSAQGIITRFIKQCKSISDVVSVTDEAGVTLDLMNYGGLVQKLVDLGENRIAEAVFNHGVASRGNVTDPLVLQSMVICYCRLGKIKEALVFMDEILLVGFIPGKSVCNVLLWGLCKDERFFEAYEVYFRMVEIGVYPSDWCYTFLIDGLCSGSGLDEALDVFDEMLESGTAPTCHLYKTLVYSFCKRGCASEAEVFCGDMELYGFSPDRKMFTSI
ncbi:hypothetical protein ACHQM5_001318 [Ranunculus cassubicifolius]